MSAAAAAAGAGDALRFEPFASAPAIAFWHALARAKINHVRLSTTPVAVAGTYRPAPFQRPKPRSGDSAGSAEDTPGASPESSPISHLHACLFETSENAFSVNAFDGDGSTPGLAPGDVDGLDEAGAELKWILDREQQGVAASVHSAAPIVALHGEMYLTNTVDEFKELNKSAAFARIAQQCWSAICGGGAMTTRALRQRFDHGIVDVTSPDALDDPAHCLRFLCVCFPELKRHRFYYWFAFPALVPAATKNVTRLSISAESDDSVAASTMPLLDRVWLKTTDVELLETAVQELGNPAAFFVLRDERQDAGVPVRVFPFSKAAEYAKARIEAGARPTIAFIDPGTLSEHPGWPLRNILALVRLRCGEALWSNGSWVGNGSWLGSAGDEMDVICWRGASFCSRILRLRFEDAVDANVLTPDRVPDAFGWEKNAKGKLAPRVVDTAATQDPVTLAHNSADFNLKLMKWRMAPDIELDKVKGSKCLLFGGGTLGCNVSRMLQSWGVRKITIIDNGSVSFSNPTRQSLFNFEDCFDDYKVAQPGDDNMPRNAEGAKMKAPAAASALRRIYPGTDAEGLVLTIPMPGHPLAGAEIAAARESCRRIDELVQEHDIVFVLTDSRESRWLPSLVASARDKLCLNVALGFDTFMVIRHGAGEDPRSAPHLGCYFCNDVVAPQNSLRDRTLDQQCTVTRPGLSMCASALAVEIAASVIHHPFGNRAPATIMPQDAGRSHAGAASIGDVAREDASRTPLGTLPHSIRGFYSDFSQLSIPCAPFSSCPACSPAVKKAYLEHDDPDERFDKFCRRAFDEPQFLEDISGLTDMKRQADEGADWEVASDGDDFDMDD